MNLLTKKGISVIVIWSFWALVALIVMRSNNSPDYKLPYSIKKVVVAMLPQGWGFFTRNPKEGITEAYRLDDEKLVPVTVKNSSMKNLVGLSRDARFAGIDLVLLLDQLPDDKWIDGKGDFREQLPEKSVDITPEKPIQYFTEGEYIIYRYEPIPFLWAQRNQENYRPYQVMRINITAKDQNS